MEKTTALAIAIGLVIAAGIILPEITTPWFSTGRFVDETGLFVGTFSLSIVNQYCNATFTIQNITNFTSFDVNFYFIANQTTTGIFNFTLIPTNPCNFSIENQEAIGNFMIVNSTNLSFINVTLIVPYNENNLGNIDESTLSLYVCDPDNNEWDLLPSSVNTDANTVTGTVTHFSTFGVFGSSGSGGSGGSGGGGGAGSGGGGGTGGEGKGKASPSGKPGGESAKSISKAKGALFDITVELITSEVRWGEDLVAKISLVNFGVREKIKVNLQYTITDAEKKVIIREKEEKEVETQTEFVKTFELPSDIKVGEYMLTVDAVYVEQKDRATTQNSFRVVKIEAPFAPAEREISLIAKIVIMIVIVLVIIAWRKKAKQRNASRSMKNQKE